MPSGHPGRALALLLTLALAGCGFRLAGSYDLPPELSRIQLVTEDFSRQQRELLGNRLRNAGAEVREQPWEGAVRLRVRISAAPDRRVATSASTGKTVDRLTRRLDYSVTGADGQALAETRSITRQKDIARDDDNLLSSDQERRDVIRDLEQALFDGLLQQLRRI